MTTGLTRHPPGFVEPTRHHSVMERVGAHQDRFLKHKARRKAEHEEDESLLHVGGNTLGTMAGGFAVGLVQGHFGTSKIAGLIPGEIVVGVVLHGVAFTDFARPLRSALRAVGNGMLAAAAATGGYGLLAKKEEPKAQPAAPGKPQGAVSQGYPEPESGGAALTDVELARFANRR